MFFWGTCTAVCFLTGTCMFFDGDMYVFLTHYRGVNGEQAWVWRHAIPETFPKCFVFTSSLSSLSVMTVGASIHQYQGIRNHISTNVGDLSCAECWTGRKNVFDPGPGKHQKSNFCHNMIRYVNIRLVWSVVITIWINIQHCVFDYACSTDMSQ